MKNALAALILLVIALIAIEFNQFNSNKKQNKMTLPAASNMELLSPAFKNNEKIPSKYTCDGENINPPLTIGNVPERAKALVLIVYDPDAPAGIWTHWIMWNISPLTTSIPENFIPDEGAVGQNSFGNNNYGGPCPPGGTHHYNFKLYAIADTLKLPLNSKLQDIEFAMEGKIIAQTTLVGIYSK
jgi:Raf kinase inhibitor-like YbhB/YbcL family protein